MLQHLYIQELLQYFQLDYLCSVMTHDIIFAAIAPYIINTYSMKQPDLCYFETIKMTSQV